MLPHWHGLAAARSRPGLLLGVASRLTRQLTQRTNTPPSLPSNANANIPQDASSRQLDRVDQVLFPPQNFAKPTLFSLNFWWRFIKFSAIGVSLIVGTSVIVLEGTHLWIEHVELKPESDSDGELARWGWDREAERWTGGARGGTDPALGWKGRHAVRSAWAAQYWGTGPAGAVNAGTISRAQVNTGAIEARLEYAHDFLSIALGIANERAKAAPTRLRSYTVTDILSRHAATLERISSKGALYDARAEYERIWEEGGSRGLDAAHIALKLGNVCARLGDGEEAVDWWAQSLTLISANDSDHSSASTPALEPLPQSTKPLFIPERLPTSPQAQRILASVLSSLSAHYAQAGQLQEALAVETTGLTLLKSADYYASPASPSPPLPSNTSSASFSDDKLKTVSNSKAQTSTPRALHELFLHHRASLLGLHSAEVAYALSRTNGPDTLAELTNVACVAEYVACTLAGSPQMQGQAAAQPLVPGTPLDPSFSRSRTLHSPADSLLRDARRTSMQAWTLIGVLFEKGSATINVQPEKKSVWTVIGLGTDKSRKMGLDEEEARRLALGAYERALVWAGMKVGAEAATDEPGAGVLESEWHALWRNYSRVRNAATASENKEEPKPKT